MDVARPTGGVGQRRAGARMRASSSSADRWSRIVLRVVGAILVALVAGGVEEAFRFLLVTSRPLQRLFRPPLVSPAPLTEPVLHDAVVGFPDDVPPAGRRGGAFPCGFMIRHGPVLTLHCTRRVMHLS